MGKPIVTSSPEILSGAPVFAGTRVPVQALIDCLKGGETIDNFLEGFPTVTRKQVVAFLEEAAERIVFLAKAEEGLAQLDQGRGVPHDEVKRRLGL